MRRFPASALSVTLAGALTAGSLFAASTVIGASPAAALDTPKQTCSAAAKPYNAYDRGALFTLAEKKMDAAAQGSATRYPFGALTNATTYDRTGRKAWTSGFFPASLWLMYQRTNEKSWLKQARRWTKSLLPIATWKGTHDLGFMIGLPAELGMRLDPNTKRQQQYRSTFLTAANSLASRWNDRIQALQSGEYDGKWGVIIDSAMNAPLLIQAGQMLNNDEGDVLTGRGEQHLLTLAKYLVREDGSTIHRMTFDPETGAPIGPVAGQGASTDSTWARGQAWAIYGFARAYQQTGNPAFLDAAKKTASFWMTHLDPQCIPKWDFNAIGNGQPLDASAAAIADNGLLLLSALDTKSGIEYEPYARTSMHTLTNPPATSQGTNNPGVLMHQTLNVNNDASEGSYVWGDTYLLLAALTALNSLAQYSLPDALIAGTG